MISYHPSAEALQLSPCKILAHSKGKVMRISKTCSPADYVTTSCITITKGQEYTQGLFPNLCWHREIWLCFGALVLLRANMFMNMDFSHTHLSRIWGVTNRHARRAKAPTIESHMSLTRKQVWTQTHGLRLPSNLSLQNKSTCASSGSENQVWLQSLPGGK